MTINVILADEKREKHHEEMSRKLLRFQGKLVCYTCHELARLFSPRSKFHLTNRLAHSRQSEKHREETSRKLLRFQGKLVCYICHELARLFSRKSKSHLLTVWHTRASVGPWKTFSRSEKSHTF